MVADGCTEGLGDGVVVDDVVVAVAEGQELRLLMDLLLETGGSERTFVVVVVVVVVAAAAVADIVVADVVVADVVVVEGGDGHWGSGSVSPCCDSVSIQRERER